MAAKKKKSSSTTKAVNKSAFVRGLPTTMSAKDVISRAKARGIEISEGYVYSIRTASKARSRSKGDLDPSPRSRTIRAEELLRAVAAEIGLSRAIVLLQEEQAKVRAVLDR